jgi:hypothetical protein
MSATAHIAHAEVVNEYLLIAELLLIRLHGMLTSLRLS